MVTVLEDLSRFILAWRLQVDMTTPSSIEVVQDAVDLTGMTDVPVEDRTRPLSDNGSGYVSRLFREYLQMIGIQHVLAPPYHPQTNGKLERYWTHLRGGNHVWGRGWGFPPVGGGTLVRSTLTGHPGIPLIFHGAHSPRDQRPVPRSLGHSIQRITSILLTFDAIDYYLRI